MTEWLIGCGIPGAYLLVGVYYARSQSVNIYRRHRSEWGGIQQPFLAGAFLLHVLCWPLMILFTLTATSVGNWFLKPALDQQERAEQLRADARNWREQTYDRDTSPEERRMAAQLADICEERAREVEL